MCSDDTLTPCATGYPCPLTLYCSLLLVCSLFPSAQTLIRIEYLARSPFFWHRRRHLLAPSRNIKFLCTSASEKENASQGTSSRSPARIAFFARQENGRGSDDEDLIKISWHDPSSLITLLPKKGLSKLVDRKRAREMICCVVVAGATNDVMMSSLQVTFRLDCETEVLSVRDPCLSRRHAASHLTPLGRSRGRNKSGHQGCNFSTEPMGIMR